MKITKKASSIIEVMVVLLIVVSGTVGMYSVFGSSQKLSQTTDNKIQAIQIAREGIEAMKNIRDTNWILFGADYDNCWNTFNYQSACVGATTVVEKEATDIPLDYTKSFIIFQDSDTRWKLDQYSNNSSDFSNNIYRNRFKVMIDDDGLYTQTGSFDLTTPLFTREIKIQYLHDDLTPAIDTNVNKIEVTSLVQWVDSSSTEPHKVEFTTLLTNWKD